MSHVTTRTLARPSLSASASMNARCDRELETAVILLAG
jgi:hypothetical protein